MHYKKTQNTDNAIFAMLRARLGQGDRRNIPAGGVGSAVGYTQLQQLSGGMLAQFSHGLQATYGNTPWKMKSQGADVSLAESLAGILQQTAENYLKQFVKSQFNGSAPLRGASGAASQGQALMDVANLISRNMTRNL